MYIEDTSVRVTKEDVQIPVKTYVRRPEQKKELLLPCLHPPLPDAAAASTHHCRRRRPPPRHLPPPTAPQSPPLPSFNYSDDDDDDYHVDGNMMPPHEWIAQKLTRNQISSFSVCEDAGRTLKGRDLSRKDLTDWR
ncbi:hypothetical protein L1987_67504 [Smallanthus sonchifolius]|uniref:Uncharacterized protein n=1 Tax=Smallanthus sonchifolius TaxID=185202 RepID=A0ACB9B412_9ASTR|nr:hypothetical protein L1987_67504 [Smallanthus sonchifolius]